jgi:signal transduction histidine kinase
MSNALKYQRASAKPEIHISCTEQRGAWTIGVKDNGIGFSTGDAEVIFQPFRRLHGRSEYQGSGLGLATCKRIIERHGGAIWAESSPDRGSTFYFTLPRKSLGTPVATNPHAG